jgi:hypothetical protein
MLAAKEFGKTKVRHISASHQWRWRESNPRPKDSSTDIYKLSHAILKSPCKAPRDRVTRWLAASLGLIFRPTRGKLGGTPAFVTLGARAVGGARGQRVSALERPALTLAGLGRERQARVSEIASRYFGCCEFALS